jgi:FeoA domain
MAGDKGRVDLIFPEIPEALRELADQRIQPGAILELVEHNPDGLVLRVEGKLVSLTSCAAETVWIQEA